MRVNCRINGEDVTIEGAPMERLLDALRHTLRLTGTKEGCGEGECGACSVLIDGTLVNSCLVPLAQAHGASITTIEGVADGERLHAVQDAFIRCGGAQCGICTPGMVLAAVTLLERNPSPSLDDIKHALAGNLCRCTGYMRIFESVVEACASTAASAKLGTGASTKLGTGASTKLGTGASAKLGTGASTKLGTGASRKASA